MNQIELQDLVALGESEVLELKQGTGDLEAALRTATGMLNHGRGGQVLLGVTNGLRIVGVEVSDPSMQRVAAAVRQVEPVGNIGVELVSIGHNRHVIVLVVPPSISVHSYQGVPYQRIGRDTSRMPQEEFARRIVDHALGSDSWEIRPAVGFSVADLDHSEVLRTVEDAVQRQRMVDPITRDVMELLIGLGVAENPGQVTNAALILFGLPARMQMHFPQSRLRLARLHGETKNEFIDDRLVEGNAFQQFREAQRFWIERLPVSSKVVAGSIERVDSPMYPTEALREALANALFHRDYSIVGGSVDLAIYDKSLEIVSSGSLPYGLSVEDLHRPHQSIRRNPLIASVFFRRGLIETFGRGTLRIFELSKEFGLSDPEFEANRHSVTVRFLRKYVVRAVDDHSAISPLQRQIMHALEQREFATSAELNEIVGLNVPVSTIRNNLQALKRLGLVELSGSTRSAVWRASGRSQ